MISKINPSKWQFYLTRPFDLFETSLWQGWYESEYMQEILGFKMDEVLCIQVGKHLVSQYRTREQLEKLGKNFKHLLYKEPKKLERLLSHGVDLARRADHVLKQGPKEFQDYDRALDFFNETGIFTSLLPNLPSFALSPAEKLPNKIQKLCATLRSRSSYAAFIKKIMLPLARREQILAKYKNRQGKYFVYQKIKGQETVSWISNSKVLTDKLQDTSSGSKEIRGLSAYPGKVRGRVHLVLDFTKPGNMKPGDILVSINTNPTMLPLIQKSAAMISDEGGITSHSAIVAREFKIPCIIGTKNATKILKTGDLVEVDATNGTAKIIK